MMTETQTESKQPLTFAHKGAAEKLAFDNRAWEMAKATAAPGEPLSETINRANAYKAALLSEEK